MACVAINVSRAFNTIIGGVAVGVALSHVRIFAGVSIAIIIIAVAFRICREII